MAPTCTAGCSACSPGCDLTTGCCTYTLSNPYIYVVNERLMVEPNCVLALTSQYACHRKAWHASKVQESCGRCTAALVRVPQTWEWQCWRQWWQEPWRQVPSSTAGPHAAPCQRGGCSAGSHPGLCCGQHVSLLCTCCMTPVSHYQHRSVAMVLELLVIAQLMQQMNPVHCTLAAGKMHTHLMQRSSC